MSAAMTEATADRRGTDEIKAVPQDAKTRIAIRAEAERLAKHMDRSRPPAFDELRAAGEGLLQRQGLPRGFLGFAMVAVDNAFWAEAFAGTPLDRRLLLLPKCLSKTGACQGHYDSVGLHCARCGACPIMDLQREAEEVGYEVIVAEGTTSVVMRVLEGAADAILGVACLDSLEKSFEQIADLGIPHQAIPLLTDGCADTTAEVELIRETLFVQGTSVGGTTRSFLPLLRHARTVFEPDNLAELVAPYVSWWDAGAALPEPLLATDAIGCEWLQAGGKRLRPFVTLAAYAVGKHGHRALDAGSELGELIPLAVQRIAVAIEALHKASLVHDDIEDRDAYRYGQPTLHRTHGIETAINIGDYLVGLGYQLIAAQGEELGTACVADILARLSAAHLQLCRGQGAELLWNGQPGATLRPIHALQIGALKTAPAFEMALYSGLRPAQVGFDEAALRQFATYVGEGFQVLDDLTDWDEEEGDKASLGQDLLAGRPTILRAFALEAGAQAELDALRSESCRDAAQVVEQARELYTRVGAFGKAEALHARLRERALEQAGKLGDEPLQELMRFLASSILRRPRKEGRAGGP